jgi:hypothetical protein
MLLSVIKIADNRRQAALTSLVLKQALSVWAGNTNKEGIKMKNFTKLKGIHWIAIIVLTAVIGFSFAACDNGTTDKLNDTTTHKLIAIANDSSSNRQILNFNMTENGSRSARALNFTGEYTYQLLLGGIVISEGTVSVSNGVYSCFAWRPRFCVHLLQKRRIRLPNSGVFLGRQ